MRSFRSVSTIAVVLVGMVLLAGGAFAGDEKFSGFLGDYKGFVAGPPDGAKLRYLKSGVDFSKYKKVMLDSVVFFLAEDAKYKGIEPNELKELSDAFNQEMIKALGKTYPIVGEPGPDVLRIRVAITKLEPGNPGKSAVTTITPVGLAMSLARKTVTGKWSGAGAAGMEMEGLDSMTNTRVVAAIDDRPGGKGSSFTKWGSAKEAFEFWAKRLRGFLDQAHGVKKK